ERGSWALKVALGEIRKRVLAANVLDVNVCGAIAPYNELLAGKLMALLLASEEICRFYLQRYTSQVSEIASQMAGRVVSRIPDVQVLTTTSLYAVGTSQYNRLRLKSSPQSSIRHDVEWIELGRSEGFGTAHLSRECVDALQALSRAVHGARRI